MRTGIVITSRLGSARVASKAFRVINGVRLIEHLISRCLKTDLPVCLAVPLKDMGEFDYLRAQFPSLEIFCGADHDPMLRLALVAQHKGLDNVIRVTHDKVFIEPELVSLAVQAFETKNLDYLYSSEFTPGSGFEIISRAVLDKAVSKYDGVEYVSYAIKNVTTNSHNLKVPAKFKSPYRFLVDYPEDPTLLEVIFSALGNDVRLDQAIVFMDQNAWARKINTLPILTVYTCAYNAEDFIDKCMGSVAEQVGFKNMEYILVDDFSSDSTPLKMAEFSTKFPNVRFVRNASNVGLASSSNVALSEARGKYILRLDADDYFVGNDSLASLINEIEDSGKDAIYPNNYFGTPGIVQNGKDCHHVGGAIFRRSAVNHVKFTEMLRGYDSYDFFVRAKDQINIGYFGRPIFFYRQHKKSMSKNNLAERARIKAEIDARAKVQ